MVKFSILLPIWLSLIVLSTSTPLQTLNPQARRMHVLFVRHAGTHAGTPARTPAREKLDFGNIHSVKYVKLFNKRQNIVLIVGVNFVAFIVGLVWCDTRLPRIIQSSKNFLYALSGMAFNSFCEFCFIPSINSKLLPRSDNFSLRNWKKNQTGPYMANCSMTFVTFFVKNSRTKIDVWAGALSWRAKTKNLSSTNLAFSEEHSLSNASQCPDNIFCRLFAPLEETPSEQLHDSQRTQ